MSSLDKEQIFRWSWEAWRKAVGPAMKSVYTDAIEIMNVGANSNGYHDVGVVWREEVGIADLQSLIRELLAGIRPLYDLLHAMIRDVLRKLYPALPNFGPTDPIPAHILANMWSQNWESLLEFVLPNSTIKMNNRFAQTQWTPVEMAKKADDFYSSMGLPEMKRQFWLNSNFEKKNNLTKCHGTAVDMYSENDYR
jgi:peptidyl-dipeptidase A